MEVGQPGGRETAGDQARLQAHEQEHQGFDRPGDEVPDEVSLQPGIRPDQLAAVPGHIEARRHTGDDA
jgi:hypothetical protein